MLNEFNASDVFIIITVVIALIVLLLYYLNKKSMKQMMQAQDFIDANRVTVQAFIIDKKKDKPSPTNLPKAAYEQLSGAAKWRKIYMVNAKVGPQIVTLICDKSVFEALPLKKNVKIDVAGLYIVGITGANLADKKKKTFTEKMTVTMNEAVKEKKKK